MPGRAEPALSGRTVEGPSVGDGDRVFRDRGLPGFGVRVRPSGRKVRVVRTRGPGGPRRVSPARRGRLAADRARWKAGGLRPRDTGTGPRRALRPPGPGRGEGRRVPDRPRHRGRHRPPAGRSGAGAGGAPADERPAAGAREDPDDGALRPSRARFREAVRGAGRGRHRRGTAGGGGEAARRAAAGAPAYALMTPPERRAEAAVFSRVAANFGACIRCGLVVGYARPRREARAAGDGGAARSEVGRPNPDRRRTRRPAWRSGVYGSSLLDRCKTQLPCYNPDRASACQGVPQGV